LLCLVFGFSAIAQGNQGQVSGKVTDQSGEALIGVNILVDGTNNGTSTDLNGEFSLFGLDLSTESLSVSYIGYRTITVPIEGRTSLTIILEEDSEILDEVVVVGYGTQSREVLTTSVSKLDETVLENVSFSNPTSALQGTIAGLRVQSTSGQPGARPRVILRGGTSINNPNGATPLYVIDGVIRDNMDFINPRDIASIQVLKDRSEERRAGNAGRTTWRRCGAQRT